MRIGVIASSAGSVFNALVEIARDQPIEWFLVTDRACKSEEVAARHGIPARRIEEKDNGNFSKAAAAAFRQTGVDVVLLYFVRLITPEIFAVFPTYNFHPSLLPAFPGMGAVRQARAAGVRVLGATVHLAIEEVDCGPVIAQIADAADPAAPAADWARISFRQKVRLGAWLLDALLSGTVTSDPAQGIVHVATRQSSSMTLPAFNDSRLADAAEAWLAANAEPLDQRR